METEFVVLTASAKMPSSCWGTYRRVAVMEVQRGYDPCRIDTRLRGVVRIVETWERCNVGTSDRCAYSRSVRAAHSLAARLNAQAQAQAQAQAELNTHAA